jgi:phosphoserine phosphatase RsbU/P
MKPEHKAIEDLAHQLRSPLSAAIARINSVLQSKNLDPSLERQVSAIRGLCHKANRVAGSARLFALLDSSNPRIPVRRTKLEHSDLMKLLVECAQDNEILISPTRGIRIVVDRKSFEAIREWSVDEGLLQQALNNLLDNAAKYSFSQTTILVAAQLNRKRICVTITNSGLPIRPQEVAQCLERGWRGEEAMSVTGEGSGIGLWIVDHIMKAHDGSVVVCPTDNSGLTRVQLFFPRVEDSL